MKKDRDSVRPPGTPTVHKLSAVARAMGLDERTLRTWAEAGYLVYAQWHGPRTQRWVHQEEVERLESVGIPIDWDALID